MNLFNFYTIVDEKLVAGTVSIRTESRKTPRNEF